MMPSIISRYPILLSNPRQNYKRMQLMGYYLQYLQFIGLITHTSAPIGRIKRAHWAFRKPKCLCLIPCYGQLTSSCHVPWAVIFQDRKFELMVMWMLPLVIQRTLASKIISILGLITFTYVVAWYPIPPTSHQPDTRLGVGFSSEVVAGISFGWIYTSWRVWIYLGAPVPSVVKSYKKQLPFSRNALIISYTSRKWKFQTG